MFFGISNYYGLRIFHTNMFYTEKYFSGRYNQSVYEVFSYVSPSPGMEYFKLQILKFIQHTYLRTKKSSPAIQVSNQKCGTYLT